MSVKTRRGDTIIEVMFGIAIFGLVAIVTINLMNNGLAQSENNLETTMARNEMDAQASALNYIHSSYAYSGGTAYKDLWQEITSNATSSGFTLAAGGSDCSSYYNYDSSVIHPFAINTSNISDPANDENNTSVDDVIISSDNLTSDEDDEYEYPFVNTRNNEAHGLWVYAVEGVKDNPDNPGSKPTYYDFYITSCWYGIGANTPTTLDTVIRLYNPDGGPK